MNRGSSPAVPRCGPVASPRRSEERTLLSGSFLEDPRLRAGFELQRERQRSGEELKQSRENRAVYAQESPGSGERGERCSTSGA